MQVHVSLMNPARLIVGHAWFVTATFMACYEAWWLMFISIGCGVMLCASIARTVDKEEDDE